MQKKGGSQNAITAIWQVHHGKYKLWFTIYNYILHQGKYKLWPPSMMAQALVFFFEPIIPVLGSSCVKNKNTTWSSVITWTEHCRNYLRWKTKNWKVKQIIWRDECEPIKYWNWIYLHCLLNLNSSMHSWSRNTLRHVTFENKNIGARQSMKIYHFCFWWWPDQCPYFSWLQSAAVIVAETKRMVCATHHFA